MNKRGPRKRVRKHLDSAQMAEIEKVCRSEIPEMQGLDYPRWTQKAVQELISTKFSIQIPQRTVGEYLARWRSNRERPFNMGGGSPQAPRNSRREKLDALQRELIGCDRRSPEEMVKQVGLSMRTVERCRKEKLSRQEYRALSYLEEFALREAQRLSLYSLEDLRDCLAPVIPRLGTPRELPRSKIFTRNPKRDAEGVSDRTCRRVLEKNKKGLDASVREIRTESRTTPGIVAVHAIPYTWAREIKYENYKQEEQKTRGYILVSMERYTGFVRMKRYAHLKGANVRSFIQNFTGRLQKLNIRAKELRLVHGFGEEIISDLKVGLRGVFGRKIEEEKDLGYSDEPVIIGWSPASKQRWIREAGKRKRAETEETRLTLELMRFSNLYNVGTKENPSRPFKNIMELNGDLKVGPPAKPHELKRTMMLR